MIKVLKIPSFEHLEPLLLSANRDTLIVFDIDDVLLKSGVDLLLNFKKYLYKKIRSEFDEKNTSFIYSIIYSQRKTDHVDYRMCSLLSELQNKNISVLGLTCCYTKTFGVIPSLREWRLDELKSFGYFFERSWLQEEAFVLEEFVTPGSDACPEFKDGVLFSYPQQKGAVLGSFLKRKNLSPKKIIFIDDRKDNVKSVARFAREYGIDFVGVWFTKIAEALPLGFNKNIASLQLSTLFADRVWLSDHEAIEIINKNNVKKCAFSKPSCP